MDDNITSNVLKFADDTKVFRMVNNDGDKQHLQIVKEKDLGITISADKEVSEHCDIAASRGNSWVD